MTTTDMNSRTVDGLLGYCDWLKEKHYLGPSAVEGWKTAIKKVFEMVEGEGYGSFDLSNFDFDGYMRRFQLAAGSAYKHETVGVYGRRIRNAIDAHEHYLTHGRPPAFRGSATRSKQAADAATKKAAAKAGKSSKTAGTPPKSDDTRGRSGAEFFDLIYPLASGPMVEMRLPKRMSKTDVDRLSAVLRTLQSEEQAQIPERTGEAVAA